MAWPGYDDWRVHGNTHKCGECGKTWQDFEGGCTYCPPVVTCFGCGIEFEEQECKYIESHNYGTGGHLCEECPPAEGET